MECVITESIELCAKQLKNGDVVAIPTETVYGLAANALNPSAVEAIYKIKNRPTHHPLILHFASKEQIQPFVESIPEDLKPLSLKFWPGPLTLLLNKTDAVPDYITGGSPRVAIRIPNHPLLLKLLNQLEFPLAAPSANPYGQISPTQSAHVRDQLGQKIGLILEGGPCQEGLESTIVGMEGETAVVYRLGSIDLDDIAACLGYIPNIKNQNNLNPLAPGMVKFHYAPKTPLFYFVEGEPFSEKNTYLFIQTIPSSHQGKNSRVLTNGGDLKEMARALYHSLHQADEGNWEKIYIEKPKAMGIGLTILDRLNRATSKF